MFCPRCLVIMNNYVSRGLDRVATADDHPPLCPATLTPTNVLSNVTTLANLPRDRTFDFESLTTSVRGAVATSFRPERKRFLQPWWSSFCDTPPRMSASVRQPSAPSARPYPLPMPSSKGIQITFAVLLAFARECHRGGRGSGKPCGKVILLALEPLYSRAAFSMNSRS